MDEKFYVEQLKAIIASLPDGVPNEDLALVAIAIMQEMAKDRRMGEITDERETRQDRKEDKRGGTPTKKQTAFIAEHYGIANFNGSFGEADTMIDAKMREKGWGKYRK